MSLLVTKVSSYDVNTAGRQQRKCRGAWGHPWNSSAACPTVVFSAPGAAWALSTYLPNHQVLAWNDFAFPAKSENHPREGSRCVSIPRALEGFGLVWWWPTDWERASCVGSWLLCSLSSDSGQADGRKYVGGSWFPGNHWTPTTIQKSWDPWKNIRSVMAASQTFHLIASIWRSQILKVSRWRYTD